MLVNYIFLHTYFSNLRSNEKLNYVIGNEGLVFFLWHTLKNFH